MKNARNFPMTFLFLLAISATVNCASVASTGNNVNKVGTMEERKAKLTREENVHPGYTVRFNHTFQPNCSLFPSKDAYTQEIRKAQGNGAKLITFHLVFPDYDENPLPTAAGENYRMDKWYRTFDSHGRTLLTLAFNYDIVSLYTLLFGVETMEVKLLDEPQFCFRDMSEDEKLEMVWNLTRADFQKDKGNLYGGLGNDPHVCHQIIETTNNNKGNFIFQCCRQRYDGTTECTRNAMGSWVAVVYYLLCIVKILAFGFAPKMILWVVKDGSLKRSVYSVFLKKDHPQKIIVTDSGRHLARCTRKKAEDKYKIFRDRIEADEIPVNQNITASFKKFQLVIDQRRLMTQKSVPVGLFHYLFKSILLCHIRKSDIFSTCCHTQCCGSWSRRFLGCDLDSHCDKCRYQKGCPLWSTIAMCFGGLVMLFLIPWPYYIRLIIYYICEESELLDRNKALESLGLGYADPFHTLHSVSPTHGVLILIYILYFSSFLLLGAMYSINRELFTKIVLGAIQDMRHIRCTACFSFLATHILLPFEKFGIFFGLLVGILYWPFVIIIFILMLVFYGIPTIYLTFRFLKFTRPCHTDPRQEHVGRTYDDKNSTLEKRLFLDDISPPTTNGKSSSGCTLGEGKEDYKSFASALTISIACIVCMWSVVLLFGESIGFIVEIFVFTLMGGIVNAGSAAKYIMLAFWMLMYSSSCYNSVYDKYLKLNSKIFELIGNKREEDIKEVILQGEGSQKNTAFKYFSNNEECECAKRSTVPPEFITDKLVNIGNQVYWRMNSLIFFISNKDVPRIPRKLFHEICQISAPGCPGPIEKNLLRATQRLFYMIFFLLFVFVVVMAFGEAQKISTTNQMLVTLAGGFVPFVVRFVMKPKPGDVSLNTYTFEGKIHQIIHNYVQEWPVYDLDFAVTEVGGGSPLKPVDVADISAEFADEEEAKSLNGVRRTDDIPLNDITTQPGVDDDNVIPVLVPKCPFCARKVYVSHV